MQRKRENLVKCEFMMYGNEGIDIERDILDRMSSWTDRRSEREDVPTFSLKIRSDSLCYETEFQAFGSFSMQSETWVNVFREHVSDLENLKKICSLEYALVYVIEFYGNLLPGFSLSDSLMQFADQIRLSSIDFDIYYHILSSDAETLPPRGPRWIFRQVDLKTRLYERNNGPNKINLLSSSITSFLIPKKTRSSWEYRGLYSNLPDFFHISKIIGVSYRQEMEIFF